MGRTLVVNAELLRDPFGRFRYTRVRFLSTMATLEEQFKKAVTAINTLITKFRSATGDYWITKIREEDVLAYTDAQDNFSGFSQATQGIIQIMPDHSKDIIDNLNESLVSDVPEFPFIHLYLDAKNAFERADYYLAVILSIVALESIIKTYLTFFSLKCPAIIQDEVIRINLRRLVTTVIRRLFPTEDYKKLIGNITAAIDLRNDIIHQSQIDIPKDKAKKVIDDVGTYVEFIRGKLMGLSNESLSRSD